MSRQAEYIHFPFDVRVNRRPDARGMFRVRFVKPNGAPGDARRATLEAAIALAQELSTLVEREVSDQPTHADATIGELGTAWLDQLEGTASYQGTAATQLRAYIVPVIGEVRCRDWDIAATKSVVAAMSGRGLKDSTITTAVRAMSAIATFGRENGWLERDQAPTKGAFRRAVQAIDLTGLPRAEDVDRAAEAAAELTRQPWRSAEVYCAAYSGLRVGEVLGLKVGDIDLGQGTIHVERQHCGVTHTLIPPKYNSVRTTIFPAWLDDAWAEVIEGRDAGEPVFPGWDGGHEKYPTFASERWKPAARAAGWFDEDGARWTFHDLRHYFCTWALSSGGLGLDVADVSRFAGHRSVKITWDTYVASRPDRIERAREASRGGGR